MRCLYNTNKIFHLRNDFWQTVISNKILEWCNFWTVSSKSQVLQNVWRVNDESRLKGQFWNAILIIFRLCVFYFSLLKNIFEHHERSGKVKIWLIFRVTWLGNFDDWPTVLKPTRKLDLSGIRTHIIRFPDHCSTNWAIKSTMKTMPFRSILQAREILATT